MKIGIIGVGHLGKIHVKCIQQIPEFEISGIFDLDATLVGQVSQQFDVPTFSTLDALFDQSEVVSIVTPTVTHFDIATQAIQLGKHVFIEKPVTHTSTQAAQLLALAEKYQVKVQVGHVERFNPALLALENEVIKPAFMEVHRLANFNPRSTDVSVVQDLMIHDIDIMLHFVPSKVKSVHANGVKIISDQPDICNARITFENGAVANLTASRISINPMRKMRLFQPNAYIALDFLEKKSQIIRISEEETTQALPLEFKDQKKWITIKDVIGPEVNAIKREFETFYHAIKMDEPVSVPLSDGMSAVQVAEQIEAAVQAQGDIKQMI